MKFKEYKLGELCTVKGGKRLPKGKQLITTKNEHPYIRVRDLGDSKYLEVNDKYEFIENEVQAKISNYIVKTDDILLSIVGTIGLVGIVGETLNAANLTENCVKLTDLEDGELNVDYLYYYLKSTYGQSEIAKGTVGAVQKKLPIKNIKNIRLKKPSIGSQKKIVALLKLFDEKIAINNRINDNCTLDAA